MIRLNINRKSLKLELSILLRGVVRQSQQERGLDTIAQSIIAQSLPSVTLLSSTLFGIKSGGIF